MKVLVSAAGMTRQIAFAQSVPIAGSKAIPSAIRHQPDILDVAGEIQSM
jgi:hypothetical protein